MDLSKLAEALGLKKDEKAEVVLAKAAGVVAEGTAAKANLEKLSAQFGELGLKLEGEKLVKTVREKLSTEPKDGDSAEVLEMKKLLKEANVDRAKSQLSSAKELAAKFIGDGKVPPAMKEKLERLFSMKAQAEALSLSQNGEEVLKTGFDALGTLKEILEAIPGITGNTLSQLGGQTEEGEKQREALSVKAKAVAARAMGKKPEAAGKK